ncbi:TIGR02186 family protein [Lutibaculum baratangense]|nr:TIGR02186 family protein [Lutibaculum baratangense]
MLRRLALLLLMLAAAAVPARAERVVAGLSDTVVNIQSNFVGTELTLFGVIQRDANTVGRAHGYTVVVTVRGPTENLVTRRKDRVAGIWMNTESATFMNVPSYYAALSSHPISRLPQTGTLKRLQIGLANLDLEPEEATRPADPAAFREALVRRKAAQNLYIEKARAVAMVEPTVFMTRIPLPANIDTGGYRANVYIFADGALVGEEQLGFWVMKTGFEAAVFDLALDQPLLYGIAAVILAVFAGWFAGVVFRRD